MSLLYGIDFTLSHHNSMKKQSLPCTGLSELPFDYSIYKQLGFFNCEPFVSGDMPVTFAMKMHLQTLMHIQRIKLSNLNTRDGLDPIARLYLFLQNSLFY
jgi:hypothetical protein